MDGFFFHKAVDNFVPDECVSNDEDLYHLVCRSLMATSNSPSGNSSNYNESNHNAHDMADDAGLHEYSGIHKNAVQEDDDFDIQKDKTENKDGNETTNNTPRDSYLVNSEGGTESTSIKPLFTSGQIIRKLENSDVLLGRGFGAYSSQGNRVFNHFIINCKLIYSTLRRNSFHGALEPTKCTPFEFQNIIYRTWIKVSGRFLKVETLNGERVYVEATQEESREKVRNSLSNCAIDDYKIKKQTGVTDANTKRSISEMILKAALEAIDNGDHLIETSSELYCISEDKMNMAGTESARNSEIGRAINKKSDALVDSSTSSQIRDKDVIFGRGHGISRHIGNQAFRFFIAKYKSSYALREKNNQYIRNYGKLSLVEQIYDAWISSSGRFVKVEKDLSGYVRYVDAPKATCLDKICTSLRQKESFVMSMVCQKARLIADELDKNMNMDVSG